MYNVHPTPPEPRLSLGLREITLEARSQNYTGCRGLLHLMKSGREPRRALEGQETEIDGGWDGAWGEGG